MENIYLYERLFGIFNILWCIYKKDCSKELMYHSDQGSQYKSNSFRNKLEELGVKHSYSKKGEPYDNAAAESFFKTLKTELLNSLIVSNRAELEKALAFYIDFYNDERLHKTLGYLTPNEKEAEYFEAKEKTVSYSL